MSDLEGDSFRIRVVALKRPTDAIQIIPSRNERVKADDHLVVIGARQDLEEMAVKAQCTTA